MMTKSEKKDNCLEDLQTGAVLELSDPLALTNEES